MSKWKKKFKDLVSSSVIYIATGGMYSFGGGGELFSSASGKKGRKYGEGAYNLSTGHYERQQKRLSESQQRADFLEQQEQKKYALSQRKVQIDAQRERVGVGSRYRTSTRFDETRFGGGKKRETLG